MNDLRRAESFDATQNQIKILTALESGPHSPDPVDQRTLDDEQVADVILRSEQVGIPARFEVGFSAFAIFVELVLIGIEQTGMRMTRQRIGDCQLGVRRQHVVVVEKRDEVAGRRRWKASMVARRISHMSGLRR